jgi:biotin operon repressor
MFRKDILTKEQIFMIPRMTPETSIGGIAREFGVSWQAVWYHVKKLREKGIEVRTRTSGSKSKIYGD